MLSNLPLTKYSAGEVRKLRKETTQKLQEVPETDRIHQALLTAAVRTGKR